jgi:hypothetical protein
MAYGPPEARRFFVDVLPTEIGLIEAWFPDFGDCLFKAVADLLAVGHESAVVLNSDSPTLPTALLVEAAETLGQPGDRAVLGPSTDGGYYLIGLKRPHRRLFEDIDWSTERVAAQTLVRAQELGLAVHQLPSWYDVDDLAALHTLVGELLHDRRFRVWGSTPTPATWSRHELARLLAETDLAERLATLAPESLVA